MNTWRCALLLSQVWHCAACMLLCMLLLYAPVYAPQEERHSMPAPLQLFSRAIADMHNTECPFGLQPTHNAHLW
jgi:hypothetical protein